MVDCLSRSFVSVRKKRQCFGCLRYFEIGHQLERASYADEGTVYSIYTCKTCLDCLDLLGSKNVVDCDDYLDEGWLWNFINRGEISPEEYLAELRFHHEASNRLS